MAKRELLPLEPVLDFYEVEYDKGNVGNQQILCPVHHEQTPSASINLEKRLWNCFGCDGGGTAIDLVIQREGITFRDALDRTTRMVDEAGGEVRAAPRLSGWASRDQRSYGTRTYVPPWRSRGP